MYLDEAVAASACRYVHRFFCLDELILTLLACRRGTV
jgi:hypothetical protein